MMAWGMERWGVSCYLHRKKYNVDVGLSAQEDTSSIVVQLLSAERAWGRRCSCGGGWAQRANWSRREVSGSRSGEAGLCQHYIVPGWPLLVTHHHTIDMAFKVSHHKSTMLLYTYRLINLLLHSTTVILMIFF